MQDADQVEQVESAEQRQLWCDWIEGACMEAEMDAWDREHPLLDD